MLIWAAVLGAVLVATWLTGTRHVFDAAVFRRANWRGVVVPNAVGLLLALTAVTAEAALAIADAAGHGPGEAAPRHLVLLAVLGFALLGLVDDLAEQGSSHGFHGHLAQLRRGHLTTGALKLVVGGLLAIAVVGPLDGSSVLRLVLDGLLVALCANLANLLDRAPGRTTKVATVCFAALAIAAGGSDRLVGVAVVVGGALVLAVGELRERFMLGDTGANALGAAIGVGAVLTMSPAVRDVLLVVVAALNLSSELVSFSAVIERVPLLRFLDRLGRRGP
jgi:UDP-N-acetylmuramyl pentapeptide phosphotransferase/UDP-N-acetylglucosamine-1-phosphate transferase